MQFTHIVLVNWRNFKKVDVALQRRVFLVGPNASGKSNFLDAFRFLRDLVVVGGGFQNAVQKRGGVSILRCLAARESSDITVRIHLGDQNNLTEWEYELTFNQDKQRRAIIKRERIDHNGQNLLSRPNKDDSNDEERLTQTYLEQVQANRGFRDIAFFFDSVRYLHIVPQLIRDPDRSVGKTNDPYGGDFLEQIANVPERTRNARLRRIKETLQIAVPQLIELELWRDKRGVPHLRGKYKHWRPEGLWLTEDQFSDGTLRLMGLLWAILADAGPLLLEEPELSLHSETVRYIPQMFARSQTRTNRQILISSHSSDLLKDEGIGLDEVLVLTPNDEGTLIRPASAISEVTMFGPEVNLADALVPLTRPPRIEQLSLFPEK